MITTYEHPTLGTVEYYENVWTGKKSVTIGGIPLVASGKKTFVYKNGDVCETAELKGNCLSGAKMSIKGETFVIVPAPKWYEVVCSVMIFMLVAIWGNNAKLCSVVPIVGGAIGGAISGMMLALNLIFMKSQKKVGIKLLIWLGMMAATFLLCFVLALLIIPIIA